MGLKVSRCLLLSFPGGQVMAEEGIWVCGDSRTPFYPAHFLVAHPPSMDDPEGPVQLQVVSGVTEKVLGYLEQQPWDDLSNLLGPLALRIPREAAPPAGWSWHPLHHAPDPGIAGCLLTT